VPAPTGPPTEHPAESDLLTRLFGFVQLEFAGALALADGRYLSREGGEDGAQSVLIVETLGAPPAPSRRRRRAAEPRAEPSPLPLARVTAVRAFEPFGSHEQATRWLSEAVEGEGTLELLLAEGVALLNRALHAQAAALADPRFAEASLERSVAVRVGYGSGEEIAAGRFSAARDIDLRAGRGRRRRSGEQLRPQERVAAVLGGRERVDACETLLLRARADLDAGRPREAALQLRAGLEALLVELDGALVDPGHEQDMAQLAARREEAAEAAEAALRDEPDAERERRVRELTEVCERVLRRRRLLRG
jgi:hypothetical protein